jgi:hypothetical protein
MTRREGIAGGWRGGVTTSRGHAHQAVGPWLRVRVVGAVVALACSATLTAQPAWVSASRLDGAEIISVPVRWCAMRGSPAAESGADVDLTGRLRRASSIWARRAGVAFRSPITPSARDLTFPLINDPNPPSEGGVGDLGDILDPDDFDQWEARTAIKRCRQQWHQRSIDSGRVFVGPVAVNVSHLMTPSGHISEGLGWAERSMTKPHDYCNHDGKFRHAWRGHLVIVDRKWTSFSYDDELLAHELGHVLTLAHGDGLDNGGPTAWDRWCDPGEAGIDDDRNLMYFKADDGRTRLTELQKLRSERIARARHGIVIDPPGELLPGDSLGDEVPDETSDAEFPSLDLETSTVGFYPGDDPSQSTLLFAASLAGLAVGETNRYWAYADTDGDDGTGFLPVEMGFPAGPMGGVDLIASVALLPDRTVIPTVWNWDSESFSYVEVSDERITAAIDTTASEDEQGIVTDVVSIEVPTDIVAPVVRGDGMALTPAPVDVEIVTQRPPSEDPSIVEPDGMIDILPVEEEGSSSPIFLERPTFPTCVPSADPVQPGEQLTLTTAGFGAEKEGLAISAYVDDLEAPVVDGATSIDGTGGAVVTIAIPVDAENGIRTISVVVTGSALAADCLVQVGELPPDEEP